MLMVELYEGSREGGADAGLPILGCKRKFPLWSRSALSKPRLCSGCWAEEGRWGGCGFAESAWPGPVPGRTVLPHPHAQKPVPLGR